MTEPTGRRRRATGSDVARLAGVSKSAVSRAYTGGFVSTDARQRIEKAARELRYRPSNSARSLTTSRSKLIGVAVTWLDNQFYPEVIQLLSDRLAEEGYRMVLFITHGETGLDPTLDMVLSYGADGVIFASSSLSVDAAIECNEAGVPAVMFNNIDPQGRVPCFAADNRHGASEIALHLLDCGARRIAVISGVEESSTSVERTTTFCDEIVKAGLERPLVVSGNYTFEGAARATRQLLESANRPDAIFCVNDHMALAAIQVAQVEFGLSTGVEILVAGFDNVPVSDWPAFSLTTYAQPLRPMIEATVSALIEAINGSGTQSGILTFQGNLIVRGSTVLGAGQGAPENDSDYL